MADNDVFGWDDVGYVAEDSYSDVLPEGEYAFEVRDVKYDRYNKQNPASSIPNNCPMAVVQLYCTNDKAKGTVFERLYLYGGGLGRISSFFKAVGLIPADMSADEPLPASFKQMFDKSVTTTGRCKLTIRKYKDKDGKDQQSNNVRFSMPEQTQHAPTPPSSQPQQQSWGGGNWGGNWGGGS